MLRLQQIYQGLRPGNETFHVETVKRIANVSDAIEFLRTIEELNRWSRKHIVLDCSTELAKDIVVSHVRDITLGKRTYHYLLSGLVRYCLRGEDFHHNINQFMGDPNEITFMA
uniref:ANF_receptor domain-containing protein n=1 Tax=Anopheles stephensi TaxID=30069 RepID=A0A182YS90_ANOST